MKLPWKREPEDLVGSAVAEVAIRDECTRALITPQAAQAGTSWAQPWRDYVSEQGWEKARESGILFLPEELDFPASGGTIAASGGWCAPSSVIYDDIAPLMEQAMRPSTHPASVMPLMVSVPAATVQRGGVGHPVKRRRPAPPRPDKAYPNPAFLAASVANPGLLPLAFMRDPTAP